MRDMGLYLVDMLQWLYERKNHPLVIVECGAIRDPRFSGHDDGLSTHHIAEWIKKSGVAHRYFSVEISAGTSDAAREFLAKQGLDKYVEWVISDACLFMEHFGYRQDTKLDFCYLDAGADPVQNLTQYRYAKKYMREPGFIVIDDVFDPRNADRGLVTVPYAQLEGMKVGKSADRQAVIAFGAAKEYPLEWL
jgi:predicted O-methyltransferase YrrM